MYTLTQEQADEVVRILGFDGQVEDSEHFLKTDEVSSGLHMYFLEEGTVLQIGQDARVEHQELVELNGDLVPRDMGDVTTLGVDYGVVELRRDGITKGYIDLCGTPELLTPEQRHIHDLRVLDVTERMMRDGH